MTTPAGPKLSPQDMARLSTLMYELAHNEKTRAATARLIAQVDPATAKSAFTDVAQDDKLARFMKQIQDERLHEKAARITEAKDSQKRDVISRHGYSDEQVKELEKIQTQYGFSDWDAAARIYSTYNPPDDPRLTPPPEMRGESTWDFPTVPGPDGKPLAFKDYIQNPRKYSNNTAMQMITDFKRKRLPAAFHA